MYNLLDEIAFGSSAPACLCLCCYGMNVRGGGAISIKRRRGITNSTWRKREMFPCVLTITDPIPNFHRFLHFLGHGCSKRLESDNEWKFQCTLEHSLGWFNWLVAVCRHFNINIALIRFPSVVVGGERNPRYSFPFFVQPSILDPTDEMKSINKTCSRMLHISSPRSVPLVAIVVGYWEKFSNKTIHSFIPAVACVVAWEFTTECANE